MKFKKITPNLMVADVRCATAFYCDVCGFASIMALREDGKTVDESPIAGAEYVFVIMTRDGVDVMVQEEKNLRGELQGEAKMRPAGLSGTYYVEVEEVDAFYEHIKAKASGRVRTAPHTSWNGMREFVVEDPDGNLLMFAERARTQA
jgi:uncharacterized glyoxalase superfamily protein PhnB